MRKDEATTPILRENECRKASRVYSADARDPAAMESGDVEGSLQQEEGHARSKPHHIRLVAPHGK